MFPMLFTQMDPLVFYQLWGFCLCLGGLLLSFFRAEWRFGEVSPHSLRIARTTNPKDICLQSQMLPLSYAVLFREDDLKKQPFE